MELCDDEHTEICYEERSKCPICEIKEDLKTKLGSLYDNIQDFQDWLDDMKQKNNIKNDDEKIQDWLDDMRQELDNIQNEI